MANKRYCTECDLPSTKEWCDECGCESKKIIIPKEIIEFLRKLRLAENIEIRKESEKLYSQYK